MDIIYLMSFLSTRSVWIIWNRFHYDIVMEFDSDKCNNANLKKKRETDADIGYVTWWWNRNSWIGSVSKGQVEINKGQRIQHVSNKRKKNRNKYFRRGRAIKKPRYMYEIGL